MNDSNTFSIIVSVVTALSSLVISVISYLITRKNEHDLESLKADLAEKQAEKNARRDYEYEARKRLYQQYEPLLFQLIELSESALGRILGLAKAARDNNLRPDRTGWLTSNSYYYDYYMASTIYRLLAPLAVIKLVQRLLTLVDLTVDPHINNQYILIKRLYLSFSADFVLARIAPCLEYAPNRGENQKEWRKKQESDPKKYYRQGIFAGVLDKAVEALIVTDPNGVARCMSFGEFEEICKPSKTTTDFEAFIDLFRDFHPKTRPVLWRVLINQVYIYKALLRTREMKLTHLKSGQIPRLLVHMSEEERLDFDWRQSNEKGKCEETPDELLFLRSLLMLLIPTCKSVWANNLLVKHS